MASALNKQYLSGDGNNDSDSDNDVGLVTMKVWISLLKIKEFGVLTTLKKTNFQLMMWQWKLASSCSDTLGVKEEPIGSLSIKQIEMEYPDDNDDLGLGVEFIIHNLIWVNGVLWSQ